MELLKASLISLSLPPAFPLFAAVATNLQCKNLTLNLHRNGMSHIRHPSPKPTPKPPTHPLPLRTKADASIASITPRAIT